VGGWRTRAESAIVGMSVVVCAAASGASAPAGGAAEYQSRAISPSSGRTSIPGTLAVTAYDPTDHRRVLLLVDGQTGRMRRLGSTGYLSPQPSFSPDGSHLAYEAPIGAGVGLVVADADGANARTVVQRRNIAYAWAGTQLAYMALVARRASTSALVRFTSADGVAEGSLRLRPGGRACYGDLTVSPDASLIGIASRKDCAGGINSPLSSYEVFTRTGRLVTRQGPAPNVAVSWAPDSSAVAVWAGDTDGFHDVFSIVSPASGTRTRLWVPFAAPNQVPVWSADSRFVVVSTSNGSTPGLALVRRNGKRMHRAVPRFTGGVYPYDSSHMLLAAHQIYLWNVVRGTTQLVDTLPRGLTVESLAVHLTP
jgi:Tol biopolymer transport system component